MQISLSLDVESKKLFMLVCPELTGKSIKQCLVEEFTFEDNILSNDKLSIFSLIERFVIPKITSLGLRPQQVDINLSLPSQMMAIDKLVVPSLNRNRTNESIKVQLKQTYRNYKDILVNVTNTTVSKTSREFIVQLCKRDLIESMLKEFTSFGLQVRSINFDCVNIAQAILKERPKLAKQTFIFARCLDGQSVLGVCKAGEFVSYLNLNIGVKRCFAPSPETLTIIKEAERKGKAIEVEETPEQTTATETFVNTDNLRYLSRYLVKLLEVYGLDTQIEFILPKGYANEFDDLKVDLSLNTEQIELPNFDTHFELYGALLTKPFVANINL
ncbi:MAG: hypothetical protein RR248_01390 [Clostridia bacterium]